MKYYYHPLTKSHKEHYAIVDSNNVIIELWLNQNVDRDSHESSPEWIKSHVKGIRYNTVERPQELSEQDFKKRVFLIAL